MSLVAGLPLERDDSQRPAAAPLGEGTGEPVAHDDPRRWVRAVRSVRALIAAVVALVYSPAVWSVGVRTDMSTHLELAEQMSLTGQSQIPYNLFQQLTIAVRAFLPFGEVGAAVPYLAERGVTWEISGVVVIVASAVVTADLIFNRLLRTTVGDHRPGTLRWCALATIGLMVATPVTLLTLGEQQLLAGYIGLTVYHNPTTMLSRPFALVLFWVVAAHLRGRSSGRAVLLMALMSVLVLFAKPSYSVCLLPAVVLAVAWSWWRGRPIEWRAIGLGFFLPTLLGLGVQASVGVAASGGTGGGPGLALAPFEVLTNMFERGGQSAWFFLPLAFLSLLFPITVAVCTHGTAKGLEWGLAWLTLAIGLTYFLLLEVTTFDDPGDLLWGAMVASFVLFVVAMCVALRLLGPGASPRPELSRRFGLRRGAVATSFSLHVLCGIVLVVVETLYPAQWW